MIWEFQLIEFLQNHGSAFFDTFWSLISMFGEELIMIGVMGFLYWCYDKEMAKFLGYSLLTSVTLNGLIKNIVTRDRPFEHPEWNIENKKPSTAGGYSFPSGHSQASASLFVSSAIWLKRKWMTVLAIVVPLLVAFSRLYLGVHFPTDVIAGLALGTALSFLLYWLHNKVKDKYILYFATLIICAAGLFYCKTEDYFTAYGLMLGTLTGFLFEGKFVNFTLEVKWWKKLIRLAGGLVVLLAFYFGLKVLFDLILEGSLYLRMLRYAIMAFAVVGLYPALFKKFNF